jgi:7-cyano-7-deazaguanine synthase
MDILIPDNGSSAKDMKVATLISGGLDSAVLVAWAKNEGYDQHAFFVNYGQDNLDREFACARINTQRSNVPLEVVDLTPLRNSFVGRFPFPLNLYDCLVKNPLGQVTTFALTALVAGVALLADRYQLILGIHHTDIEYRPVLKKSMSGLEDVVNHVVESFTDRHFSLLLPFKDTDRKDVINHGLALGVEFENTWSCHEKVEIPCGLCEGCQERAEAFAIAGITDPQLGQGIRVPVHAKLPDGTAARI